MTLSNLTWQTLQQAADLARQEAAHEQAIAYYTRALAELDVPQLAHNVMLLKRADSCRILGEPGAFDSALAVLIEQVTGYRDDGDLAAKLSEVTQSLRLSGNLALSLEVGRRVLTEAEKTDRPDLKAAVLSAIEGKRERYLTPAAGG